MYGVQKFKELQTKYKKKVQKRTHRVPKTLTRRLLTEYKLKILIITTYFTPRENKQVQRQPIIAKPEVETKNEKAATVAANKGKISRWTKNKK